MTAFPTCYGIIPARYASSRFPGKPLADIAGMPMFWHVYQRAARCPELRKVVLATDDQRIAEAAHRLDVPCVMTRPDHESGTDRVYEAACLLGQAEGGSHGATLPDDAVVVNIQGDEPFIRTKQIERLCSCFDSREVEIATLIKPVTDPDELHNPNRPKVVVNKKMEALLFSRSTIPHIRGSKPEEWLGKTQFFSHIGMYAYRADILQELTLLPIGKLEQAESLEQLRWLENGYHIKTAVTEFETIGIDTPEDLEAAKAMIG